MQQPVIFTDLDDTLFQTARKCPNKSAESLLAMSSLKDGSASGFATARQQNLIQWLRIGSVVPVTARSRKVLSRVNIEQTPAICSNGGCIISEDGEIDNDWHSHQEKKAGQGAVVSEIYRAMTDHLDAEQFRHWIVSENGLDLYIVIKSNTTDVKVLHDLEPSLKSTAPAEWRLHKNGNNLAFLPAWLNKRNAVTYLLDKIRADAPDKLAVGIGDSLSDCGFMDICDFAMTPTNSQLWAVLTQNSNWLS